MLLADLRLRLPSGAEHLEGLVDIAESRFSKAALIVGQHLDIWQSRVFQHFQHADAKLPSERDVERWLMRQTVVWRELLCGERTPESYVPMAEQTRATVRQVLVRSIAIFVAVCAVVALVVKWSDVAAWYSKNGSVATGLTGLVISVLAALGISPRIRRQVGRRLREDLPIRVLVKFTLWADALLPQVRPDGPLRRILAGRPRRARRFAPGPEL